MNNDHFKLAMIGAIGIAVGGFISFCWTGSDIAAKFMGTGVALVFGIGAAHVVWFR